MFGSAGHLPELIIILILGLIVLGPGKLPQVGGAVGKTIREFRKGAQEADEDEQPAAAPVAAPPAPAATTAAPPVAATPPATATTVVTPPAPSTTVVTAKSDGEASSPSGA